MPDGTISKTELEEEVPRSYYITCDHKNKTNSMYLYKTITNNYFDSYKDTPFTEMPRIPKNTNMKFLFYQEHQNRFELFKF
jgi:hypothetical protein